MFDGCSIVNDITVGDLSLGIERLLIATYATSWTPARVSVNTPPAGFAYLGAVDEESSVVRYKRSYYDLPLTIFENVDHREVSGFSTELEFELHSNSADKLQWAIGTGAPTGSNSVIRYGTHVTSEYTLLGVTDFIDGTQVVHHIVRVSPDGDVAEKHQTSKNSRIPLKFMSLPVTTTLNSMTQMYIGSRYFFAAS